MNGENTASMILMLLCMLGCAALFLWIGLRAKGSAVPANFWAHGPALKAEDCRDVAAYNAAYCKMWVKYSLWYFAAGAFAILGIWFLWAVWFALILCCGSLIPGFYMLFREYNGIAQQYLTRKVGL